MCLHWMNVYVKKKKQNKTKQRSKLPEKLIIKVHKQYFYYGENVSQKANKPMTPIKSSIKEQAIVAKSGHVGG